MFSKAKRFDSAQLKQQLETKKDESSVKSEPVTKNRVLVAAIKDVKIKKPVLNTALKLDTKSLTKFDSKMKASKTNAAASDCSSDRSVKSCFITPKATMLKKSTAAVSSLKKSSSTLLALNKNNCNVAKKPIAAKDVNDDLLASREVEIRNKDSTIKEYEFQIEEMKREINALQKKLTNKDSVLVQINELGDKLESVSISNDNIVTKELNQSRDTNIVQMHNLRETSEIQSVEECTTVIANLENKINVLERDISRLESEVNGKQMELSSMEELVCIRDSLCKDLQDKLTTKEALLLKTLERLELVKNHHSLALEANESIRREYKIELDALKSKLEEEKQAIITNAKSEQDIIKKDFREESEDLRRELLKEKEAALLEMKKIFKLKEDEIKAKIEQVEEKSREQLKLCEIQFEQRSKSMQEHWCHQQDELCRTLVELNATKEAVSNLNIKNQELSKEVKLLDIQKNMNSDQDQWFQRCEKAEKQIKEQCENYKYEIDQLKFELNKAVEGKRKFEASLTVTRETVRVLGERLNASDCEVDKLETKINKLIMTKQRLEEELSKYRNKFNSTVQECNDYREALLNILESRETLSEQHAQMVAHNASLVESLQLVEGEAQRELGDIREGLLADVDHIKKEAQEQIQKLRQELHCKQAFLEEVKSQLRESVSAASDSRALLELAAQEITRLEVTNEDLQCRIHNQQSMEAELSLLRQENEDLCIRVAQQTSVLEALRKGAAPASPKKALTDVKSPLMQRKGLRAGKENSLTHNVSPLRERNY